MFERVSLADVDGVLCVACSVPDYCEPRIVVNHWPTRVTTRDAMRYFFDDASFDGLARLEARRTRPGEYFVGIKQPGSHVWQTGKHLELVDGGHTQSVKTDIREVKTPKTRKGTKIYWSSGAWVKHTSKGVEKIDPFTV